MIINGDAGDIPLGDGLVHCVVTSPPYWSLRKYAGEQERDWPGVVYRPMPGLPEMVIEPMTLLQGFALLFCGSVGAFTVLLCWCCCVLAGRADRAGGWVEE